MTRAQRKKKKRFEGEKPCSAARTKDLQKRRPQPFRPAHCAAPMHDWLEGSSLPFLSLTKRNKNGVRSFPEMPSTSACARPSSMARCTCLGSAENSSGMGLAMRKPPSSPKDHFARIALAISSGLFTRCGAFSPLCGVKTLEIHPYHIPQPSRPRFPRPPRFWASQESTLLLH